MRLGHLQPLQPLQPLYDRPDRPGSWAGAHFDTSRPDESAAQERERAARQAIRRLEGQGADRATCRAVRRPYEGGAD
ncbi:hypothetical protein [Streptomyces sp. NEAU-YJ-81]|uniref:hypothetical protein n=1 Tax=Streptomyces sp. NEAU-YJ-81 TaxID=2820288 RepID=UPI001ABCBAEA|nr:hypothetical protein [Streptomyces sp. NEAU-YJ-81]MBO3677618.1 hypothetical protein [Streptomyces sp. NEAU-YJ-81]